MMNRDKAMALLSEYTKSPSLIKHAMSVEAAMEWYATNYFKLDESETMKWCITGLLHDFDYEMYPTPEAPDGHPYKGNQILREQKYPEDMLEAIMGHAAYTNVARTTDLAKTLFAVDELSGLITAAVLVRPDKSIHNLEVKSVMKKMKDKAFAKGCNREDIRLGAEELGMDLAVHIGNVISALQAKAKELELEGNN